MVLAAAWARWSRLRHVTDGRLRALSGGEYFRHARRRHGCARPRHGQPLTDMGSHRDLHINDAWGGRPKAVPAVRNGRIGSINVREIGAGDSGSSKPPRRGSSRRCGRSRRQSCAARSRRCRRVVHSLAEGAALRRERNARSDARDREQALQRSSSRPKTRISRRGPISCGRRASTGTGRRSTRS